MPRGTECAIPVEALPSRMATRLKLAIVLSGGGARAAYQAGVLQAIADWLPAGTPLPFTVVTGTSAGAINAAAIAAGAQDFGRAATRLRDLWSHLHACDIYRTDAMHLAGSGARWLVSFIPAWRHRRPASLLDNAPLATVSEARGSVRRACRPRSTAARSMRSRSRR